MEQWKDIPGFEGLYQASSLGQIKSLPKKCDMPKGGTRITGEKILKPDITRSGYYLVTLFKNKAAHRFLIHRLIAFAYLAPSDKPFVNHLNGIKSDNRADNLEWCTKSENEKHAYKTGLKIPTTNAIGRTNELNAKSRPVMQLNISGELIQVWPSLQEVNRKLSFAHGNIGACARGALRTAYGFKWQYVTQKEEI